MFHDYTVIHVGAPVPGTQKAKGYPRVEKVRATSPRAAMQRFEIR